MIDNGQTQNFRSCACVFTKDIELEGTLQLRVGDMGLLEAHGTRADESFILRG